MRSPENDRISTHRAPKPALRYTRDRTRSVAPDQRPRDVGGRSADQRATAASPADRMPKIASNGADPTPATHFCRVATDGPRSQPRSYLGSRGHQRAPWRRQKANLTTVGTGGACRNDAPRSGERIDRGASPPSMTLSQRQRRPGGLDGAFSGRDARSLRSGARGKGAKDQAVRVLATRNP